MGVQGRWTVGGLTIGQSPRDDILPDLEATIGPDCRIVQVGALDGLESRDLTRQAPWWSRGLFVTRLRNGAEVSVRRRVVHERLRACVSRLESDVDLIVLLCTGDLPRLVASCTVLHSGRLLRQAVGELEAECLGVLTPAAGQARAQRRRWSGLARNVAVAHASPYGSPDRLLAAAEELRCAAPDAVVMDCIGYTRRMRRELQEHLGLPALTALDLIGPAVRKEFGV